MVRILLWNEQTMSNERFQKDFWLLKVFKNSKKVVLPARKCSGELHSIGDSLERHRNYLNPPANIYH